MPGGWAKKAGVEANDRILKIGDREIANREEMDQALQSYKPGDDLGVEVQRGQEKILLSSQIGT
jgi:S1-C subfamily serine protease